jgi:hypothetical protein
VTEFLCQYLVALTASARSGVVLASAAVEFLVAAVVLEHVVVRTSDAHIGGRVAVARTVVNGSVTLVISEN